MKLPRVGSWRSSRVVWGLALVFCAWALVDFLAVGATSGVAHSTFDSMVRWRLYAPKPDARIVIVDVDEGSLARMAPQFGRWPWPRDTLATVLAHLEKQEPAAIVWDILFSDADKLNPGGDAAFDAEVRKSRHSHFSVVRLAEADDTASRITAKVLPGLWLAPGEGTATVAMIPPVLPAVAAGALGYNNAYADSDGVVRRFRYVERLPDGGVLKSTALSAAAAVDPTAAQAIVAHLDSPLHPQDTLLNWRRSAGQYERVPFWQVFQEAERNPTAAPRWKGRIVVIGSTAPALHDVHASPLARAHPGPDIIATAIDNALHRETMAELPRWLLAALSIAMCLAIAAWAHWRSVASLEPLLLTLPAALLALTYASLHGSPVFLDLQAPAALALAFLVSLRLWSDQRRRHWCELPADRGAGMAVLPLARRKAWAPQAVDRLIDAVERDAPHCRVVVADTWVRWPGRMRWPELAQYAAIVGPAEELRAAHTKLQPRLKRLAGRTGEPVATPAGADREALARLCLRLWADFPATAARMQEQEERKAQCA
ncbi:CHASE2 domain-containing protein [Ramlibacter albus]|uniref:CHASE2 domain-containing protein n=1 Tax=Ramlibacter albus TaxID=2079448 RepID=A0A923S2B8_9BURK|nr:CHASE2 domain-containing protein [Ramlibacter albus]MBC5764588.1 CHASE2 domain-containing protein [Ramlibacter albus]